MSVEMSRTQNSFNPLPRPAPEIGVQHLPEEIIVAILREVKVAASSTDFLNCLRTCQQWHRIGLGVHGRLDLALTTLLNPSIHQQSQEEEVSDGLVDVFATLYFPVSEAFISELRTLTIHVLYTGLARPLAAASSQYFSKALIDVFTITRKLSTLSIKFSEDESGSSRQEASCSPRVDVAAVVAHLPKTVINLEIDTARRDIFPDGVTQDHDESRHLCHHLSIIIPRLRHLRLRVAHICGAILANGPIFCVCPVDQRERFCSGLPTICDSFLSSKLSTLNIWLPWEQDEKSNSFVRALELHRAHSVAKKLHYDNCSTKLSSAYSST